MAPHLSTPAMPQLLNPSEQPPSPRAKLMVAIDLGTSKIDACCRIRQDGVPLSPDHLISVKLGHIHAAPLKMGLSINNTFIWGDDVNDALTDNIIDPENVMELFKLSLYKDHATKEITARVNAQLSRFGLSKEMILSLLIKEVIQKAKNTVAGVCGRSDNFDEKTIQAMSVELFISVPAMWKAPANRVITMAARMTGVDSVQLVLEPLCSLAYFMYGVLLGKGTSIRAGENILVLDAGGGTTDITCYEMLPGSENAGAGTRLRRIGEAVGGLCGSQFINEAFLRWLRLHTNTNLGGFDNNVRSLGFVAQEPYTGFYKAANEIFDETKAKFTPAKANSTTNMSVCIPCNPHEPSATANAWTITLPCALIKSFFDGVIDDNFQLLITQITPSTKKIIMPGGLGKSTYVRNQLHHRLQDSFPHLRLSDGDAKLLTGQQPVSAGALLRYNELDLNKAPRVGSFGMLRDEPYDKHRHPDGTIKKGDIIGPGRTDRQRRARKDRVNYQVIQPSAFTKELTAHARWDPVLLANHVGLPAPIEHVTATWQMRLIDRKYKGDLAFQLYWTDDPTMVLGSPVFVGSPADKVLRPQVEEWGPPTLVPCPDLKALGFDLKIAEGRRDGAYQIEYLVEVKERGPNAAVKVRLVLPGGPQPFNEFLVQNFPPTDLPEDIKMLDILDEAMDDEGFTPFTRN